MAARRFLFLTPLLMTAPMALLLASPTTARAEDTPDVPNAKFNFIGETTGGVFVRSGPSDNYYPTTKLEKGTQVKVVGIKYQWLKIEPPEGSFSYVGKAFVDRHGDGKAGRVNNPANVRAGSALNQMKTTIQSKLDPGADVKILGEEDEYYKIEPPAGAYLFINQQYVRMIRPVGEIAARPADAGAGTSPDAGSPPLAATTNGTTPAQNPATTELEATNRQAAGAIVDTATGGTGNGAGTATRPTDAATAAVPAASPQGSSAEGKFEKLESEFAEASQKSVIDQPLSDLLTRYQLFTNEEGLPESLKRVADARIAALKVRQEAKDQFLATRKTQQEMQQRSQALLAEREELEERIKETQVDYYTAVGTLRPSSLQSGPRGTTLYRLTDPQTGRTLVYVRAADPRQLGTLLNQFVGVKGEMHKDPLLRLNVIQPTETKAVDESRLGTSVAASVMPPSLLSKIQAPTVSTEAQNAPVEGQ